MDFCFIFCKIIHLNFVEYIARQRRVMVSIQNKIY
jgi:hypothetical protein